jgi:hypothetical protein
VVRTVAHYVSGLHRSRCFCGNIFRRVHIHLPSMSITFPLQPAKSVNAKALLLEDIRIDTKHF